MIKQITSFQDLKEVDFLSRFSLADYCRLQQCCARSGSSCARDSGRGLLCLDSTHDMIGVDMGRGGNGSQRKGSVKTEVWRPYVHLTRGGHVAGNMMRFKSGCL